MKKIISLLLLLFVGQVSFSQDNEINKKRFDIHIMPLTMTDLTPRLRLGAEYNFNNTFAYCLEIGVGNPFLNKNRLKHMKWKKEYQFLEIRPEIKYYFGGTEKINSHYYYAAEAFFIKMNTTFENGYYHLTSSNTICSFESADFVKVKYGIHIKAGWKYHLFNKVSIDQYIGIGIANRSISYSNVINSNTEDYFVFEEWLPQPEKYEGESTFFHLTGGIKIGWMF